MSVYNERDRVGDAIESIRAQTFADWKLAIANDGSTDGTAGVLDAAADADSRIDVLHLAENRGQYSVLNELLSSTRGGLIALMDADDVSLPHRFARQVEVMRARPEIAALGTAVVLVNRGEPLRVARRPEEHDEIASVIYKEAPFFHPTVMARRELFDELGGYNPTRCRANDVDLWLRGYRR